MKFVTNRSGNLELINLKKVINRLEYLINYPKKLNNIDISEIVIETINNIYDGVKTTELDQVSCRAALNKYIINDEYGKLAARITINNYIKNIDYSIKNTEGKNFIEKTCNIIKQVLAPDVYDFLTQNSGELLNMLDNKNNYRYSYRGFTMLIQGKYLINNIETPDFATLRIAAGILVPFYKNHNIVLKKIHKLYNNLSSNYYTHATPTLLNSGTINSQFSSCVLIDVQDNLIDIANKIKASMLYQKHSAGIGINLSKLRCNNSHIKSTNGISSGLISLVEVLDKVGYYIDQGGGKRPGCIAPYIADYHPDLLEVLKLRSIKNTEQAAKNHRLYYAVWVSDYFMKCTRKNKLWYFIDPNINIIGYDLATLYGKEFTTAYKKLVSEGKYISSMPARDVWVEITKIQANSGLPYIVSKDNINKLRNQDAIIYSSNLCAEVTLPTSETEIGVCNLASISIKKFLSKSHKPTESKNLLHYDLPSYWNTSYYFDLDKLKKIVTQIVKTMDIIIDINHYPKKSKNKHLGESNKLRRPIGIGIMGLADALCKLKIPFGTDAACKFRANIQEAIYYYAMEASINLAQKKGSHAYFSGHQTANGNLHPLLFGKYYNIKYPFLFDWHALAERAKSGVRHSVLTCCMPTGNTAMIMGNSACFEPYESNIYRYSAFAEELIVINKYLRKDLNLFGLNSQKFVNRFISLSGRIQDLKFSYFSDNIHFKSGELEPLLKKIYRVAAFEISPIEIINMALAAQPFVDQSQSMNLFIPKISVNIFNYFYYAWKNGLKTLVYYTRSDTSVKETKCKNCVI